MIEVRALLAEADPAEQLAPCGLRELVLGRDVLEQVGEIVADLLGPQAPPERRPRVSLLVDGTLITRSGQDVKALVEARLAVQFDVTRTVLDDGHAELHVVDEVLDTAATAAADADVVVALGGGTVSDIGKVAAQRAGVHGRGRAPLLVAVQTAASVDGYTDDVSVVVRGGVKRTVASRWPDAVIADAGTISEAPGAMNTAGYGEMTSMLTAPADWTLAALFGAEKRFHEAPLRLLGACGEGLEEWSPGVGRGAPDAVEQLTRALAIRGIVTGVAGTTAVLSGVEHLVSHMLDLHQGARDLPMGLHGAQVGVAGLVAAAAWEMLHERMAATTTVPPLREDFFDQVRSRHAVLEAFAGLDADGRIGEECWSDYSVKLATLETLRPRIETVLAGWTQHAALLRSRVRPTAELAAGLRAAGAVATFEELDPTVPPGLARWAVAHCALMRNRVTVVDLLALLGWWEPHDVEEVLRRAQRAAARPRADGGVR